MSNQCDSKKFYDTEWEAERAASIAGANFKTEMVAYRHGKHWHIGNKRRGLRSKHRQFNKTYCEACDVYMKRGQYNKHLSKRGHLSNVRKKDKAAREEAA